MTMDVQKLWDVSALQEQVATLTTELSIERRKNAILEEKLNVAVARYEKKIDELQTALNRQNRMRFDVDDIEAFYADESV